MNIALSAKLSRERRNQAVDGALPSSSPRVAERRTSVFPSAARRRTVALKTHGSVEVATEDVLAAVDPKSIAETGVSDASSKYLGKKAVVVGAGPGGAMAAAYLAIYGFTVKVFEKRPDPLKSPYARNRANQVTLRKGTVDIMKKAGVEFPENGFRKSIHLRKGRFILSDKGLFPDMFDTTGPDFLQYGGERNGYAEIILEDIRKKHGDKLSVQFNAECKGIDFEKKQATFLATESGEEIVENYDFLVGADGYNSSVRRELQKIDKSFTAEVFRCKRGYKAFRNLSVLNPDDEVAPLQQSGWMTFVVVDSEKGGVADAPMSVFVLFNASEKSTSGTLATSTEAFDAIKGREYEYIKAAAPSIFPEVWAKEIAEQLKTAPYTHQPDICRVSKNHGPSTVLIGDAVHSVGPDFGYGANMAISDSAVLEEALLAADGDLESVGMIFHNRRFTEVHTFQTMQLMVSHRSYSFTSWHLIEKYIGWVRGSVTSKLKKLLSQQGVSDPISRRQINLSTAPSVVAELRREALLFTSEHRSAVIASARPWSV